MERDQLAVKLLPLVKRIALQVRERLPLHIEMADLVSTGVLGLVDAVLKFDARRHVKLESYARYRIRGAILDGLRGLDSASRDMRKKVKKAETVYRSLAAKLHRPPNDEEMAGALGVCLEKWFRAVREHQAVGMDWLRPMGSVGVKESWPGREEMLVADNQEDQFQVCYRQEQREILRRALGRIPERERQVVQLYYDQDLTMKEVGEKLGVSESRVSQLHSAALARLRLCVERSLNHLQSRDPSPDTPRWTERRLSQLVPTACERAGLLARDEGQHVDGGREPHTGCQALPTLDDPTMSPGPEGDCRHKQRDSLLREAREVAEVNRAARYAGWAFSGRRSERIQGQGAPGG